jgi:glutathione S-transferase
MKLYYFDGKGRAETARLVMRVGGKDFEDIRFNGQEFAAKYKALSPSGQV